MEEFITKKIFIAKSVRPAYAKALCAPANSRPNNKPTIGKYIKEPAKLASVTFLMRIGITVRNCNATRKFVIPSPLNETSEKVLLGNADSRGLSSRIYADIRGYPRAIRVYPRSNSIFYGSLRNSRALKRSHLS